MDCTYMEVGTWVILRKHSDWSCYKDPYHGKRTRIKYVYTNYEGNQAFCLVCYDRGKYQWYPNDMILASDAELLRSPL